MSKIFSLDSSEILKYCKVGCKSTNNQLEISTFAVKISMFCEIMMKKIAIPTREDMVDDHFGHCAYYTVVTLDDENQVQEKERLDSPEGCGCKSIIASFMQEMGTTLMLAGNMGMGAYNKLSAHGITVIRGCHGKVDDVLRSYQNGEIQDSLESCDHHDCTHHEEKPVYVIPSFGKK